MLTKTLGLLEKDELQSSKEGHQDIRENIFFVIQGVTWWVALARKASLEVLG